MTRDALLFGNGYAFINRVDGEPRELLRLQPDSISVSADGRTQEPTYKIASGPDVGRHIDRRDILHIKAPSLDGVSGDSPITQAKEAIASILAMEEHCSRLFGNGARPSGVIEMPNNISEDGLRRMKAGWDAVHSGAHKSGKTALLWDGAKFNALTFSSVDAQFLELRRFAIDEIARVFRVPPHMLFELGRATWGNAEEMGATFVTYTLQRWLRAWQGEVRLKLFEAEERDTFFAEFLVDDLLRADISARAVAYRIAPGSACPCERSRTAERKARAEAARPTARQRGYDGKWQQERAAFLKLHPACVRCGKPSTVVNHKVAHRGDQRLFWSRSNWEAVCKPCHDGPIQSEEKGGRGRRLSVTASGPAGAHKKISSRIEVLKS